MELESFSEDNQRRPSDHSPIEPATQYRGFTTTAVDIEPPVRGSQVRMRLGSQEEPREQSTLVTHTRRHSSQTEQSPDETAAGDNVSELSFTSAYSNPSQYWDRDQDRMETTV